MITAAVLLAIAGLLALLLFLPVYLCVSVGQGRSELAVRWLIFRISLNRFLSPHQAPEQAEEKNGEKSKKKKKTKRTKESKIGKRIQALSEQLKIRNFSDFQRVYRLGIQLLGEVSRPLRILWKGVLFKKFCLHLIVSGEDAAATGLEYGLVWAATGSLHALSQNFFSFQKLDIRIDADYNKGKYELELDAWIGIRPATVLYSLAVLAVSFAKRIFPLMNADTMKDMKVK